MTRSLRLAKGSSWCRCANTPPVAMHHRDCLLCHVYSNTSMRPFFFPSFSITPSLHPCKNDIVTNVLLKPRHILRSRAWPYRCCSNMSQLDKYSPVMSRYCRTHAARAKCVGQKQWSNDLLKTYIPGTHCSRLAVYGHSFVVRRLRFHIQSPVAEGCSSRITQTRVEVMLK